MIINNSASDVMGAFVIELFDAAGSRFPIAILSCSIFHLAIARAGDAAGGTAPKSRLLRSDCCPARHPPSTSAHRQVAVTFRHITFHECPRTLLDSWFFSKQLLHDGFAQRRSSPIVGQALGSTRVCAIAAKF
jgi:hypothetical protein